MNVTRALALFTHLIALTGFFSVFITGQVDVIAISVFLVSLVLSFINERFGRQYYLSQNVTTVLAFMLLIYVCVSVILLGVELFNGILIFLVYTQVLKLLGRKGMRDIVQIYVLSFFQFLAGAILTVDFSYGVVFVVYVAVAIWAIMVFSMKKESVEASGNDDPQVVTPLFMSTTLIISFGIFLFTALIFVSIPRIRSGFVMSSFLQPEALKTGFSDEVELGRVGEIKRDSSPVFRARIVNQGPQRLPEPLYWRGIALDEFDGKAWRASGFNFKSYKADRDGIVHVRDVKKQTLAQEIITEPLDTDILFALNAPAGFGGVAATGRISDVNDSYMLPGKVSYRLKYVAYSDLSVPHPDDLRGLGEEYPVSITSRYLQLPELGQRVGNLAREVTRLDDSVYDKAVSIKRFLVSNMSYTLTLEKGTSEFPLESFLFDDKDGHCEYFATAMVVMLREIGIPARIVNGFAGGEWNEYGKFFLVRESDAHSWVEVFFPSHGWVVFDPTPAGDGAFSGSGPFSFIASYVDYLKYRWNRYIVDFNQRDQIHLFSEMRDKWNWQKGNVESKLGSGLGFSPRWALAVPAVALFGWIFLTRLQVKTILKFKKRSPDRRASIIYRKALSLLSKKGFKKSDSATPREFAKGVVAGGGAGFKGFERFTESYLDFRFGERDKDENVMELERLLGRLEKEIKRSGKDN